jgi:hypothetical protein
MLNWGLSSREFTNYTYDLTDTNLRYLAHTVAAVTGKPLETIEGYLREPYADGELVEHVIRQTVRSELCYLADDDCRFGRRLGWYAFVRAVKPEVVVETGVDKGLGSVLICHALIKNRQEGHSATTSERT